MPPANFGPVQSGLPAVAASHDTTPSVQGINLHQLLLTTVLDGTFPYSGDLHEKFHDNEAMISEVSRSAAYNTLQSR